jgi:XTP/dITP diphosphohydrolase
MTRSSPILFATTNSHKVDEVRAVLGALGFVVESLSSVAAALPEPVEDQETFRGNARLKAVYYADATGRACLAEDSGLEVDALGGEPGVYSARYAGTSGSRPERDEANNRKLLLALRDVPPDKRSARFVCAMCLAEPGGRILAEVEGYYEGVIAEAPRGSNGFGYDPLLYLPDAGCTSAELPPEAKNARSHRGQAARALARKLEGFVAVSPTG